MLILPRCSGFIQNLRLSNVRQFRNNDVIVIYRPHFHMPVLMTNDKFCPIIKIWPRFFQKLFNQWYYYRVDQNLVVDNNENLEGKIYNFTVFFQEIFNYMGNQNIQMNDELQHYGFIRLWKLYSNISITLK